MKCFLLFATFLLAFHFTPIAEAHPGRTDANGGHTCRTNCESWGLGYGEYHSHNGGGSSGGSTNTAPVQSAPIVQQQAINTLVPTRILPTSRPTPTTAPYIETALDKKKMFKVTEVVDGDTLRVNIRGKIESVRLLAIDTPETKDPRKPVQCFGMEATKKMQSLVSGTFIKLIDDRSQGNRDKYQRLLRYAYLENGTFVNREMVAQGYAFSYKQYPTKFLDEFNKLEREAREKELGLWKAC